MAAVGDGARHGTGLPEVSAEDHPNHDHTGARWNGRFFSTALGLGDLNLWSQDLGLLCFKNKLSQMILIHTTVWEQWAGGCRNAPLVWNPRQAENPFCFHLLPPYRPALHLGLQESEMTWRLTRRHHHSRGRPLSHLCDFGPAAPFHGRPFLILSPGESLVIFYVSAQDYLLRYSVMACMGKVSKEECWVCWVASVVADSLRPYGL